MSRICLFDSNCLEGQPGQLGDVLEHVRKGGVAVFRQGSQAIGFHDRLRQLTAEEISLSADSDQVHRVAAEGFEKIHEILSAKQIFDLNVALTKRMRMEIGEFICRFSSQLLGYSKRIYIYGLPVVRLFVPHDAFAKNRDLFSRRQGFLQIQGPHHDTWFDHATESLNVWVAVGRVRRGNGLIIYPDHGKKRFQHDGSRCMPKNQSLGRSMSFDLEPGDILFFHGETLHSSELNVTDETRYVITNRFTLQKPRFKEHEQWQSWFDSALLGTPFDRLASWPTYFSVDYLLYKLKRLVGWQRRGEKMGITLQSPATPELDEQSTTGNLKPALDPHDLAVGEIRAVSQNQCVLKSENGLVYFSRFCPHEGADLVGASYQDGRIQCPWHHLSFDARTGKQPCRTLRNLELCAGNDDVAAAQSPGGVDV